MQYRKGSVKEKRLKGHVRSFAWEPTERQLLLVGNNGLVARTDGEDVVRFDSGTRQNLRAVSFNSSDGTALIVGNAGSVLLWDEKQFHKIGSSTSENVRAVSWNSRGTIALIAGNQGTLFKYSDKRVEAVGDCRANLRRISWKPHSDQALIASNCFGEEFIPSPNLFSYEGETDSVSSLNEGRADLIGLDWHPNGMSALVVGYDVVWHNGIISNYNGSAVTPIAFENRRVYLVAVAWDGLGGLAAIATATTQAGIGKGMIYLWDGQQLKQIYDNSEFYFSAVAWDQNHTEFAALASTATRTYNC